MSPFDLFVTRELFALELPRAAPLPDGTWLVELPAEHASRAWNHFAARFADSGLYPLFVFDVNETRQRCAEAYAELPVPAALLSRAAAYGEEGGAAWRGFEARANLVSMQHVAGLFTEAQHREALAALLAGIFPAPSGARAAIAPRALAPTPGPWTSGLLLTPCEAPWMMPFVLRRRPYEHLSAFQRWNLESGAVPTRLEGDAFVFQAEPGRFEALAAQVRRDAFADTELATTLQEFNGLTLPDDVDLVAASGLLGA
jgi:hypothetical protein